MLAKLAKLVQKRNCHRGKKKTTTNLNMFTLKHVKCIIESILLSTPAISTSFYLNSKNLRLLYMKTVAATVN